MADPNDQSMIARVWTVEELNRVHPLPDGWAWRFTYAGHRPAAVFPLASELIEVVFDGGHVLVTTAHGQPYDEEIHDDVALAVILASKGLDSLEAMAEGIRRIGNRVADKVAWRPPLPSGDGARLVGDIMYEAAGIVSRGRVDP